MLVTGKLSTPLPAKPSTSNTAPCQHLSPSQLNPRRRRTHLSSSAELSGLPVPRTGSNATNGQAGLSVHCSKWEWRGLRIKFLEFIVDSPLLALKAAISPLNLFFCKVAFAPLQRQSWRQLAELPCSSSSCLSVQPALQRHLTGWSSLRTTGDFLAHYLFDTTDILISALFCRREADGFVWPTPCPRNCITSANLWKIQIICVFMGNFYRRSSGTVLCAHLQLLWQFCRACSQPASDHAIKRNRLWRRRGLGFFWFFNIILLQISKDQRSAI